MPELNSRDLVFVRKARLAAGQALFYLHNATEVLAAGKELASAKSKYVDFALEQVSALVNGVHISRDYLNDPATAPPPVVVLWRDRVWSVVNTLRRSTPPDGNWADPIEALIDAVDQFLARTHFAEGWAGWRHVLTHVERWVRRRFTVTLGLALAAALILGVGPVRSLLFNQGWRVLLPILIALSPVALHYLAPRRWGLGWGSRAFVPTLVIEPERTLPRWPEGSPFTYFTLRAFALDFALFAGVLVIEGVALAHFGQIGGGTSYFTVFVIFALVVMKVRLCRFFDRWDFIDERAIRWTAAGIGLVIVALVLWEQFYLLATVLAVTGLHIAVVVGRNRAPRWLISAVAVITAYATVSAIEGKHYNEANSWRAGPAAPGAKPARIDAAAWPFAGDGQPVVLVAASGGGSRAAIYAAKTLVGLHRELPTIEQHINAISSVSGGSLASAAYIARRYRTASVDDLEAAMGQDFLLPTLRGALTPLDSRGSALERDWDVEKWDHPSLGGLTLADLTERWNGDAAAGSQVPPFPLPLFNTCTLDSHDVVISPIPRQLYTKANAETLNTVRHHYGLADGDQPTWVVDRDGIYGFEDLLPSANPELRRAVRASANFPFGFPLVRVETSEDRLVLSPLFRFFAGPALAPAVGLAPADAPPAVVHLTDGGVLSNSGLWSLFQLMTGETVLPKLAERGVLLIIVEASKMPEYSPDRRSMFTLYGALGDKNPVAQRLHRNMFDILHARLGRRLAIVQLDLIPQDGVESFNVHTTWALDPQSKRKLSRSFDRVWPMVKPAIEQGFARLAQGENPGDDMVLRPPLD